VGNIRLITVLIIALATTGIAWAQSDTSMQNTADTSLEKSAGKIRIAVFNFKSRGGFSVAEACSVSAYLRNELTATGQIEVLSADQMTEIFKTHEFLQKDACFEAECMVEAGRLLNVDKVINGKISRSGRLHSPDIKMIDVGSGQIEHEVVGDITCGSKEFLSLYMHNAARAMAGLPADKSLSEERWHYWLPLHAVIAGGVAIGIYLKFHDSTPDEPDPEELRNITFEGSYQ
jgi:hypothetical protein